MRAKRNDIETEEGREKALTKLVNVIFHNDQMMVSLFLNKPSRSNGTGDLTTLEFAKKGRAEFRTVESKIIYSNANIPLHAILGDFDRFMPDMGYDYAEFMALSCHKRQYNRVLNGFELYTAEGRLDCLKALYEAHGASGIDQPSENFTFDAETLRDEFNSRVISPGRNIKRPDQAAQASYVGLMNAICDLFLEPSKQKPEDMIAWQEHKNAQVQSALDIAAE